MRVTWVTRSFLDYRVPVFSELNRLTDGNLTLIYYRDVVPSRVRDKITHVLGDKCVALKGELRLTGPKALGGGMANTGLRIPFQPGLVKTVRNSKPDVVVSDGFFQWTYAALWLRARNGIPHVMCYERTKHTERKAQWYRTIYRKTMMRWIDAICCSGRLCGDYVTSLGFPEKRITYGHMVADVEGMRRAVDDVTETQMASLRETLSLRGTIFIYTGQLAPRKGVDKLLAAWRDFSSKVNSLEATLLLVGDGPLRGELKRYCEKYSLTNIRFAGAIDYDALAAYYKVADVFVIPTLEDNWSLVVPEAMACGLPILSSEYNGCWPEYVTLSNGWVFDSLVPTEAAGNLRKCLDSKQDLLKMGNESSKIVCKYTAKQAAEAIFAACEIAIG